MTLAQVISSLQDKYMYIHVQNVQMSITQETYDHFFLCVLTFSSGNLLIRRGRNQHSLAFQIPSASKDVYQYSFFSQTIRDWNDLPESLISSSELSDDSVSKFTSLVKARD